MRAAATAVEDIKSAAEAEAASAAAKARAEAIAEEAIAAAKMSAASFLAAQKRLVGLEGAQLVPLPPEAVEEFGGEIDTIPHWWDGEG